MNPDRKIFELERRLKQAEFKADAYLHFMKQARTQRNRWLLIGYFSLAFNLGQIIYLLWACG